MAYVAIRGGASAITGAAQALELLRARSADVQKPLEADVIADQLHGLVSRLMSEGGVHHPRLAALAAKQAAGDTLEASFLLRAWRSTRPRLDNISLPDTAQMRCFRRISSAFKDVPGGQYLGPTADFSHRLLRYDLLDESPEAFRKALQPWLPGRPGRPVPDSFPKVLDALRAEGLLPAKPTGDPEPHDITRTPLSMPAPRSAALMTMARGETGGLLAIAYSSMRGYGEIHPTVAELRVGHVPVFLPHPETGEPIEAGEVLMTECEVVAMFGKHDSDGAADAGKKGKAPPTFGLGYGACFGHNEVKAISMAILDQTMQQGLANGIMHPAQDPEFVLMHVDGIESMGFCTHYKMPHYVTFQSDLDRLRTARKNQGQP